MRFHQKWVAVARIGLILWENDATGLRIISKHLPGLKLDFFFFFFFLYKISAAMGFSYPLHKMWGLGGPIHSIRLGVPNSIRFMPLFRLAYVCTLHLFSVDSPGSVSRSSGADPTNSMGRVYHGLTGTMAR